MLGCSLYAVQSVEINGHRSGQLDLELNHGTEQRFAIGKIIFRKRNAKESSKPLLLNAKVGRKMFILIVFILELCPDLEPCVCVGCFPKLNIICWRAASSKKTASK